MPNRGARRCTLMCFMACLVVISFVAHLAVNRLHYSISESEAAEASGFRSLISRNAIFFLARQSTTLSQDPAQTATMLKPNVSAVPFAAEVSNVLSNASIDVTKASLITSTPKDEWFSQDKSTLLATPAASSLQADSNRSPFFDMLNMTAKMEADNCDDDFGFGLTRRWKASANVWCSPTIKCHPIQQTGHGGAGDNLCVVEDGTLDLRDNYNDATFTTEIVRSYRDTQHADMPYVHFRSPVITTKCEKTVEWRNELLPGWNGDWLGSGLNTSSQVACTKRVQKALLIIQRDEFANFYHDSEDFFNSFLALMITGLRPDEVSLMLADLYPWGPYESLWKHLFPDSKTAWEMRDMEPTCYSKIIIGIYGPASPLTLINQVTACTSSPLVKGYARWVWTSFGFAGQRPPPKDDKRATLLWMSRKSSVLWPEQAFCDDRYFKCSDWSHLGVRSLGRVIQNEDEIVAALQRSRPLLRVNHADYNKLPFAEQVRMDLEADIMAGPHGAGLTHLLFLRDETCVFEVFVDGSESNLHYQNMAAWRGIPYYNLIAQNPTPVDEILNALSNACIGRFLPVQPPTPNSFVPDAVPSAASLAGIVSVPQNASNRR